MYIKRTIYAGRTIEVEKVWSGRYGKKTERGEIVNLTPEAVKKNNEKMTAKKLRWILNTNFGKGDYHVTLTYEPANRPERREAEKRINSFMRKMKRRYEKHGEEFKWVKVTEYENKAIHHHIVLNGFVKDGVSADDIVAECWPWGRPKFTKLDDSGDYKALADYLVKETGKTFREKDSVKKQRYSRSRNLKEPKIKVEKIKASSWRKDPKPPKGYYIDKDSIFEGVNEVTGRPYQYYRCIRLPDKGRKLLFCTLNDTAFFTLNGVISA